MLLTTEPGFLLPSKASIQGEMDDLVKSLSQFSLENDHLTSCFVSLRSADPGQQLEGATRLRKLLQRDDSFIAVARDVINAELVPRMISLLGAKRRNGEMRQAELMLLKELAWGLTNITAGTSEQTASVVEHGGVEMMMRLLGCREEELQELALWCLANIAGDRQAYREVLASTHGFLQRVRRIYAGARYSSTRRVATWCISNICRVPGHPPLEVLEPYVEFLLEVLNPYTQADIVAYCLGALSAVLKLEPRHGGEVLDISDEMMECIVHFACGPSSRLSALALDIASQFCSRVGTLDRAGRLLAVHNSWRKIAENITVSERSSEHREDAMLVLQCSNAKLISSPSGPLRNEDLAAQVEAFFKIAGNESIELELRVLAAKSACETLADGSHQTLEILFRRHELQLVWEFMTLGRFIGLPSPGITIGEIATSYFLATKQLIHFGDRLDREARFGLNPVLAVLRTAAREIHRQELMVLLDHALAVQRSTAAREDLKNVLYVVLECGP